MVKQGKPITILYAEDDKEDQLLVQDALYESRLVNELHFAEDGIEVMEYLSNNPLPGLILLDLNMPKKDGREVLEEIKTNERLRRIPICILTTSQAEEDILNSYDLGVNSFIRKPVTFSSLVDIINMIGKYWFEIVELPDS